MLVRLLAAAALATAALTVTACGGGSPASAGSHNGPSAEERRALLDYASCMREHGVDMPDPTFSDGGARVTQRGGPGKGITPEKARLAEQACKHFQDKIKPPAMSDAEKERFKKEALAQSRCMREHGIDMPDPTFNADGGAMIKMKGSGPRPDDPKFQAAQRACMPDGARRSQP
jgi:hypothetical protein